MWCGPFGGEPHRIHRRQGRCCSSLTKGPASKGPPKTADGRRGQLSVAVCGHTSVHAAGSQATHEPGGTSSRTKSFKLRLARFTRPSVPQAFGTEDRAGGVLTRSRISSRLGLSGPAGEGNYPLRGHGPAPTSPPGGVLRLMPSTVATHAVYLYEGCVLD